MKIRTKEMISADIIGNDAWTAIDDDTYDGAEDSSNRHDIGYGATEAEAIADLRRLMQEKHEANCTDECCRHCTYEDDEELRWRTETGMP